MTTLRDAIAREIWNWHPAFDGGDPVSFEELLAAAAVRASARSPAERWRVKLLGGVRRSAARAIRRARE